MSSRRADRRRSRLAILVCCLLPLAAPFAMAEEWYDAYQKGLDSLSRHDATKAVESFQRAIKLRPSPGDNVITYGTNQIDHYYPYLRLAEAQLMAGNPLAAREALIQSEQIGKEPGRERLRLGMSVREAIRRTLVTSPSATAGTTTVPNGPKERTPEVVPMTQTPLGPPAARPPGPSPGTIVIQSQPDGATILLDGRFFGESPLTMDAMPGRHVLVLRKEGFLDETIQVRIDPGARTEVARSLTPVVAAPVDGTAAPAHSEAPSLVVFSEPPAATVYIDDEPIGDTDPASGRLVKKGIEPGKHRLRISLAGHKELTREVDIAPSGTTTLKGVLPALAPPSQPPSMIAVYAGIGLVLVGIAGGVLLIRRRVKAEPQPTLGPTVDIRGRRAASVGTGAATPTPRGTPVGEQFGDYRLIEILGRGGMARVFKAERNGEVVALKQPLPALLEEPEFLKRFIREADIGRTLHHPNIIRILDRGEVQGTPFFTMEYVRGQTLKAYAAERGALPAGEATKLVVQTAEALDYAHLKGVIHRDLKPSNIMVLEDGAVKVMDYGIARARRFDGLTVTGSFLGTPDYVAPETAEGKASDGRSDLYSLGILFYEIITGKRPFEADTPIATIRKHCVEPPTPPTLVTPSCPPELEAIILRLLRKAPDERYQTAEELIIDLRDYLNK